MSDKDRERLKRQISAQVKYETRWVRRVPLLLGLAGVTLALIGCFVSTYPLIALGSCAAVLGFGAQAVLWYGLRDEDA